MARIAIILRAAATVALTTALTACSGAPASSPVAVASPVASPAATLSPSASPSPSPSATPAATESPAPSASARPRPSIDQSDLDAILTSSITLLDLAEGDLAVTVAYVDPGSDDSISLGTYSLASTDQLTNQVPAGTYRIDFRQPADSATGPTCTIEIADGDAYVFAAVEGAIAITLAGEKPSARGDLFVATSSLCLK